MGWVNYKEAKHAGLDIKKLERIISRLSRCGRELREMDVELFGGSGTGSLRFRDDPEKHMLVLGYFDGTVDGGDGAAMDDEDGLSRGEC